MWRIREIVQDGETPIMRNVDIRLADLPVTHRFVTWSITQVSPFDNYRKVFRWIAECRVIRVCPCPDPVCGTVYLTIPDGGDPAYEIGWNILLTNKGSVLVDFDKDWIKIEALGSDAINADVEITQELRDRMRDKQFPHKDEVELALKRSQAPSQPSSDHEARGILRDWVSTLEEKPVMTIEIDSL